MKELLQICEALKKLHGLPCALATVIEVTGSAYRRPGARMLILPNGQTWGMISGGCLDHDVICIARRVLKSGSAEIVRYDSTSSDDIVFGTGLGCNGVVSVFIEPVNEFTCRNFLETVERVQTNRETGAMAMVISSDAGLVGQHGFLTTEGWVADGELANHLEANVQASQPIGRSASILNIGQLKVFVQILSPPIQLVIFGGWMDIVPLVRIAKEIGFQTTVVDARLAETSLQTFCEADNVLLSSPGDALMKFHYDERTFAVLMNHHFERDQEALTALTKVNLPFIGLLGPAKRRERLLAAVRNDGVSIPPEFEGTLHGPVGLDVGAKTPEEIALSIIAEILAVSNRCNAEPIRDRPVNHHTAETPTLVYA